MPAAPPILQSRQGRQIHRVAAPLPQVASHNPGKVLEPSHRHPEGHAAPGLPASTSRHQEPALQQADNPRAGKGQERNRWAEEETNLMSHREYLSVWHCGTRGL